IPSSITSIGDSAFYDCRSITSIEIPSGVTSIGDYVFYNCSSITSIKIPSSVTSIGKRAFYNCSRLTKIEISSSVTIIGPSVFSGCINLTIYCEAESEQGGWDSSWNSNNRPVVWGHNNIKTDATYDYIVKNDKVYLTKYKGNGGDVVIPNTIDNKEVIAIGEIFKNNKAIISVSIPSSVTSIGWYAFSGCSNLTKVTFRSNSQLTSIGWYAFSGCSSLTSIEIPSGVTSIGHMAFHKCSKLSSISIPASVTHIESLAFLYCNALTIACEATSELSEWKKGWNTRDDISQSKITVIWRCYTYVNDTYRYVVHNDKVYLTEYKGNGGDVVIPKAIENKEVVSFGEIFRNNKNIISVEIPSSVTSISSSAFWGCSRLTIYCEATSKPTGWTSEWNALNNYSLIPVVWNCAEHGETKNGIKWGYTKDGVMTIAGYSGEITQVVIPRMINRHSVTHIGSYAFSNCSSLTSIEIPSGVTSIGFEAFSGCSRLTSIEIPSSVMTIQGYAFSYCSSLTSIEIPSSVTSIGNSAFAYCSRLTIYCEMLSEPIEWNGDWNYSNRPVVWGHKQG
ncbi:MAG: leucine-rich repeat domain-containing protein, partial [Clostridia bacterium]|nr:leucine-rich repeat domain-containing protein [Clostridia bacterium]